MQDPLCGVGSIVRGIQGIPNNSFVPLGLCNTTAGIRLSRLSNALLRSELQDWLSVSGFGPQVVSSGLLGLQWLSFLGFWV